MVCALRLIDEKSYAACDFSPKTEVLAAFSGGADSTALLLELCRLRGEGALYGVAAAHVHHGLRGADADADEVFCKELCRKLDIPFYVTHVDAAALAREGGLSVESASRKLRYDFFHYLFNRGDFHRVAVAHHITDQAETLLQHLLRGSGLTGLCGMRQLTSYIARPLLNCSKAEILAYLAEKGQGYCEDATNAEPIAQRNRLRANVLPLLAAENPRAAENMARCAAHLQEDADFLELLSMTALVATGENRAHLALVPTPLRRRALMIMLAQADVARISSGDVMRLEELLVAQSGARTDFAGGIIAVAEGERIVFKKSDREPEPYTIPIAPGETAITPQGRVKLERAQSACFPPPEGVLYLHGGAAQGEFYIRLPCAGDKFSPFGMEGRKLLSDYFTDRKLYGSQRFLPLLCDEGGIAAICGCTIDERFRIGSADTDILALTYESNGGGTHG